VYYFSDCQTGASSGCVPGNNANSGTQAAPKRDLSSINLNTLPAGSQLYFARGGAWNVAVRLDNRNVTAAAPLTLADYGSGAIPVFNTPSGTTFSFGMYGDTTYDGGYVFRNLKLDGRGTGTWGAFVQGATRDVVFDGVEIANFAIGIHSQQSGGGYNERLTIRNSFVHHNSEHGFLGDANGLLIDGTRFEDNNPGGGGFEHGVYIGGHTTGITVRNSIFRRNSLNSAGVCDGGNLTIHGTHEAVLLEGNLIEHTGATPGCYGISLTAAYSTSEYFRNAVVRNNTIVNLGNCAICISSAPGVLVENNRVYNTQATYQVGVLIPAIAPGPGDAQDSGAVVRNNIVCQTSPASGSSAVQAPSAGTISGNTYLTGSSASSGACAR
jgi:Right handed beta helix region